MTEFRPRNFQTLPPIIKNLLIINTLVFFAQSTIGKSGNLPDNFFENTFGLHTWQSPLFKPWQFVTYLFLHGGWGHIFWNMFALWMFGSTLENLWGPKRFLLFYLVTGLGAAFCHMVALYFENQQLINAFNALDIVSKQEYFEGFQRQLNTPTIGASGAVFGCLAAFGYLFPNDYIYMLFFPIKVKWAVIIYIGGEFVATLQNSAGDNVAHIAHLGGALVGLILVYYWNKTNRRNFY